MADRKTKKAGDRTVVLFGNGSPQMHRNVPVLSEGGDVQFLANGEVATRLEAYRAKHIDQSVTSVTMWEGFDDADNVDLALSTENDRMLSMIARVTPDEHRHFSIGLLELEDAVRVHTGGSKPDWVVCSDPEFEKAIANHFDCPRGEPTALLTNTGRDALHSASYNTATQAAASNYIALTANATSPAAGDSTLTAEITTGGGGLVRAQATYAHTAGTNTTTLTKTFTANGSDSLPVTIAKIGVFNAASGGTMTFETLLSSTATLNVSGDNVAITETITEG